AGPHGCADAVPLARRGNQLEILATQHSRSTRVSGGATAAKVLPGHRQPLTKPGQDSRPGRDSGPCARWNRTSDPSIIRETVTRFTTNHNARTYRLSRASIIPRFA